MDQSLRERTHAEAPIVWAFLGDSITHGALHTWGRRDYVELFTERVRWQLRRPLDVVIKTAISGYTVPALADGLERLCLRFRPDIACIMLGTNDATAGPDGVPAFEEHYVALVERIRAETGALVLLQTPNPIDLPNAQTRAALPCYVDAIHRVAARTTAPLCDHYAAWQAYHARTSGLFYLLNDPLHPNADGHLLFANTLLDYLGYGPMEQLLPVGL